MTEHLPECPIRKPCCDDEEFPEHGFCGNYAGRCLHCMAECICEQLRACETRVLGEAVQRVETLAVNPYYCEDQWHGAETHLVTSQVITAVKGDQP